MSNEYTVTDDFLFYDHKQHKCSHENKNSLVTTLNYLLLITRYSLLGIQIPQGAAPFAVQSNPDFENTNEKNGTARSHDWSKMFRLH